MTEFTKGPGWDWEVDYEDENGNVDTMSVFGQRTIEEAIAEARYSFSSVARAVKIEDAAVPAIVGARRV